MNEIYFKLFVLPFLDRIEAPAIKKNSFHELEIYALEQQGSEAAFKEDKNWLSETKWARLLINWINSNTNQRKFEISLVAHHEHCVSAFTSLLVQTEYSKTIIISIAPTTAAEGFESCFRDIFLNTAVQGTSEKNSNEKTCYTISF